MLYSSLQFPRVGYENMRKHNFNKKGLSTVVSTLLMIIVVMVGMTLVFSYVTFYSQNYQSGTGSAILESLTIENIWIEPPNNTLPNSVNITVYNTGTPANYLGTGSGVTITLDQIYVNGSLVLDNAKSPLAGTTDFSNIKINPGSQVTVEGQYIGPAGFVPGTYDFKIVTSRGSDFGAQYTYP